ncbi:MAG: tetratricopeptide repeat protein [Elusimicrobiota bacterium]|jgi:tetratricopeptide (TPR) repeat protein
MTARSWFVGTVLFAAIRLPAAPNPALLPGMSEASQPAASSCRTTFETARKQLLQNPENENTWEEFRVCMSELKRWNDAEAVSRAAIQKGTRQSGPHVVLGVASLHMKEYAKAADAFNEAIRLKPDDSAAYYYLGMAHLFLRQPGQAAQAARRAVELDPSNANHQSQLAYAYLLLDERGRCEQAAQKAVQLDPNNVAAYKVLGNLYAKEGRPSESDKAFEQAIHANGRAAIAHPVVTRKAAAPPAAAAPPPPPEETSSPEELCQTQWSSMKTAVIRGDTARALTYYSDYLDTREQYQESFEQMGPRARDVFAGMGELYNCQTVLGSVTCKMMISSPRSGTHETTVRFERNPDKIWRIRSF